MWLGPGNWPIGVLVLFLLLIGGIVFEIIGERAILKIRAKETDN